MMNYAYDTSLQETMILTEAFHTDRVICDNGSLYKFIWVQEGKLTLIVDHVEIEMEQDEIISVSNLHRTEFKNVSGRYLALLFNENFYGIYKHQFICRLRYAFPFEDYTRTSGDRSETAVAAYLAQHQRDIGDFGL